MNTSPVGTSVAVSGPNGITIYGTCTAADSNGNPTVVTNGVKTYTIPSK